MKTTTKIHKLPPEIYNRIAAGEVVERPASIVKELVENSIDAGANKIIVDVIDGGIKSIKVTDDGCGIPKQDLSLAFLAHATSKIETIDDLNSIISLGFRGEALASIASVSHIKMVSRLKESELGAFIELQNGEILDTGECGSQFGTIFEVNDIFDNIPARKKFLKKSGTELSNITNFIEKLILSRPEISFKYTSNGKTIYQSNGTNLEQAIFSVWGNEVLSNLVSINADMYGIKLKEFVSRVGYAKHNNTMQIFVVNGRVVVDSAISKVVFNCFSQYLMTRQFPIFVLNLEIDPSLVDVNVHPNKLEIRFANKDTVCKVVAHTVSKSINAYSPFVSSDSLNTINNINQNSIKNLDKFDSLIAIDYSSQENIAINTNVEVDELKQSSQSQYNDNYIQDINLNKVANIFADGSYLRESSFLTDVISDSVKQKVVDIQKSSQMQDLAVEYNNVEFDEKENNSQNWLDSMLVGSIFDTYIILQDNDNVYFIDQHAAHEKLLYDKFCNQIDSSSLQVQQLLVPYVFMVSQIDKDMVLEKVKDLEQLGFEIREFGSRELAICSVPLICNDIDLQEFVGQLLSHIKDNRKLNKSDILIKKLQQSACKAAIKGKQHLTTIEMQLLLTIYRESGSALFCPHGRPVVYVVTRNEIEKWFKRVV
ncbi:MAG: DNA mismatch repair endonuclease MutL [Firmicutes bacterium]|nr:DNA mismatch repair endonuclease MutL [Bacillota bacterium]MCL1953606.1 DNA mismatch repair endonuclease MutL [Bacillota bacterium]